MKIADTERLLLRRIDSHDAFALRKILGDAEVMQFSSGTLSEPEIAEWIQKYLVHHEKWGFGPYALVTKDSAKVIGYCGLFHYPDVGGQPEIEIGYRLAKEYWGKGFATEAALAVSEYGFHSLGLTRLIAMTDPSNFASIRVAKKVGMQYEKEVMFDGYTHPDHVYVIERG